MQVEVSGNFKTIIPDKNVPRLVERDFPERLPRTEKKAKPTKRCVVCYKNN